MNRTPLETGLIWFFTIVTGILLLLPVYWIFLSSVTPADMLFSTPIHYIPLRPTLENYMNLFQQMNIGWLLFNTGSIIVLSLVCSILLSLLAAYAFARIKFRFSGMMLGFIVMSGMLPATSTIIPLFQYFRKLHLLGTFTGVVLLYVSALLPFTVLIFVNFLLQLPKSLEEAALVDGAGIGRVIFSIAIPLMKPAIATMAIINFILCMNEFMIPLIFGSEDLMTLSVGITQIHRINQYAVPWDQISALATIMLIPIVLFVMVFERRIMEGIMSGSVKG